jgi:aryl-alcohol dehydrogenase-like predicted oxidoreductase
MQYRMPGKTGLEVPRVGFGCIPNNLPIRDMLEAVKNVFE